MKEDIHMSNFSETKLFAFGAYTNAWANWRVAEPQKSRVKPCAGGCGARMRRSSSTTTTDRPPPPAFRPPPPHHGHLHVDRLVVWAFLWLLGWVPRSHPIPLPAWVGFVVLPAAFVPRRRRVALGSATGGLFPAINNHESGTPKKNKVVTSKVLNSPRYFGQISTLVREVSWLAQVDCILP